MYRFSLFDSSLDTSLTKLRDSNRYPLFGNRFTLIKVKLPAKEQNNSQHCWTNKIVSCCVHGWSRVQTDAITLNNAATCSASTWKDTDCKTSMHVRCSNHVGRALHYGSNIVGLRFGDHTTKEILRVVSSKVLLVSNFAQPFATTRNNMQQSVKKDATYDNQQCCIRLQGAY